MEHLPIEPIPRPPIAPEAAAREAADFATQVYSQDDALDVLRRAFAVTGEALAASAVGREAIAVLESGLRGPQATRGFQDPDLATAPGSV